jgi:uracil-DNA glycosylase
VKANQDTRRNPFGMDEECTNCDALCETREQVVHGYGDVGADFLFVAERPTPGADGSGVPFGGDADADERFYAILERLGLWAEAAGDEERGSDDGETDDSDAEAEHGDAEAEDSDAEAEDSDAETDDSDAKADDREEGPPIDNAFVTHLTRCRHPEREPTDEEVRNCEAFLTAEVRMINPEILVPVGQRALRAMATEYTTTPAEELHVDEDHATTVRGRGFELVPMKAPGEMTDADVAAFLEHFSGLMGSDYRQTKGRRGR